MTIIEILDQDLQHMFDFRLVTWYEISNIQVGYAGRIWCQGIALEWYSQLQGAFLLRDLHTPSRSLSRTSPT